MCKKLVRLVHSPHIPVVPFNNQWTLNFNTFNCTSTIDSCSGCFLLRNMAQVGCRHNKNSSTVLPTYIHQLMIAEIVSHPSWYSFWSQCFLQSNHFLRYMLSCHSKCACSPHTDPQQFYKEIRTGVIVVT